MRACLLTLQMWNLRTDFTKVSIGDYFSALCGNYKALRVLPFFPTGALANQQACNLLAGAIGNKKREEKRDWLIEDINKINDRIEKISILITCFCLQFHLKENMHEYAKSQGLLTEGSFDIQKASSKIGQLEVKRKLLLFELTAAFGVVDGGEKLTFEDLTVQLGNINLAGISLTLENTVAEYFGAIKAIQAKVKAEERIFRKK